MADASPPSGPGAVLALVRSGRATTRADLARLTGLSRSTVSQRIDALMGADYLFESGDGPSNGGRPPRTLAFKGDAGVVLVADLGATHGRLAVYDLDRILLADCALDQDIGDGPRVVLDRVRDVLVDLLAQVDRPVADVRAVGVGLPGPVEYSAGRAVDPPIMPGWDGVEVPAIIHKTFDVPVLVDNDVNLMARGEYWTHWRDQVDNLLFVKVATGIGCGIVAGGDIYRGEHGAAGDLGHVQVTAGSERRCRCGNMGCLEAVAGGAAIAADLAALGHEARQARDVAELAASGNSAATRLIREAGRHIGSVLAGAVNLFDPGAIVLGGDIADAANHLAAGVREVVYQRSTVLATHDLRIRGSRLGAAAGVTGAAVMATEWILRPAAVDQAVAHAG